MTDPGSDARETLGADQYLYTSHAHLGLVCAALRSGHWWQVERALGAAERHLNSLKDKS